MTDRTNLTLASDERVESGAGHSDRPTDNNTLEWRVTSDYESGQSLVESFSDEVEARQWAADEQDDYPNATFTVECREVGPWRVSNVA